MKLTKLAISVDDRLEPMEPMPFNQNTFNDDDPFVQKIKNEGLVVN